MMENAKSLSNDECARMKEKYYQELEELHEQYDTFLHDMKHTMRTIASLASEGATDEIIDLIEGLRMSLSRIEQNIICSHKILNALFTERKSYAEEKGVVLEYDIVEPLYLQDIDDMDLVALIGNILDNAIEAEEQAIEPEGVLFSMKMAREGRHIIIQVENSYSEKENGNGEEKPAKGRVGAKHGIGLRSVRKIVRKYGGMMEDKGEYGRFRIKIILSVQSGWKG
ncbi:MAG: sensor histidine kinase [Lachnospiraceae bacterium]|nr:sensor histidine kinase [Lachnospiraceae bacterium]